MSVEVHPGGPREAEHVGVLTDEALRRRVSALVRRRTVVGHGPARSMVGQDLLMALRELRRRA